MDNSLQSLRFLYEKNDIFRGDDFKEYKYDKKVLKPIMSELVIPFTETEIDNTFV